MQTVGTRAGDELSNLQINSGAPACARLRIRGNATINIARRARKACLAEEVRVNFRVSKLEEEGRSQKEAKMKLLI